MRIGEKMAATLSRTLRECSGDASHWLPIVPTGCSERIVRATDPSRPESSYSRLLLSCLGLGSSRCTQQDLHVLGHLVSGSGTGANARGGAFPGSHMEFACRLVLQRAVNSAVVAAVGTFPGGGSVSPEWRGRAIRTTRSGSSWGHTRPARRMRAASRRRPTSLPITPGPQRETLCLAPARSPSTYATPGRIRMGPSSSRVAAGGPGGSRPVPDDGATAGAPSGDSRRGGETAAAAVLPSSLRKQGSRGG